jgi:hypothetical protein
MVYRDFGGGHPADVARLAARRRLPAERAGGQDDGELLAGFAITGVEDDVPGVGVDAGDPSDLAFDSGFLTGLADSRLGDSFAEVDRTAGDGPVAVVGAPDQQDVASVAGHHDVD